MSHEKLCSSYLSYSDAIFQVAELCLVRSKSDKSFGAVGHCLMSMYTGIQLSCQYSHFGESTYDSLLSNLCIVQGVASPKSIDLGETLIGGDSE